MRETIPKSLFVPLVSAKELVQRGDDPDVMMHSYKGFCPEKVSKK